ncbi:nicotinamide mononucleotide transporter [Nonlabens xylanidelens]|uniref:Nicotinamide riboside transporter PnuC n=1 Tax=Nonlabens xylanidelens TaxID=191564 RepID=A0A2S6IRF2_9FLAO|nr:nicotinamide riboside transporter PnuC [Nonlabens xylanidelens]PPK96788.1 nicotinamide mononucleotide transporter [Nonlabens xylanidelens]PQJ13495.1 nicotinamide mononucleotide transporter [Nonlabens xylanidelens]
MEVLEFIFGQYRDYSTSHIVLEQIAITASVISVIYSYRNSVLVFPFGIIGSIIFVYLLDAWNLLGDMIISIYYFAMSIYGWYIWTKKDNLTAVTPITSTTSLQWFKSLGIFVCSGIFVYFIYWKFDRFENLVSYVDIITTGIFFAGAWLMALRKLEHWLILLVGNLISIPLYFYKGLTFTAILYIFFTIMSIIGYQEWKKYLNKQNSVA